MKEQLAQLIETYAAARTSGNAALQQYATQMLSNFLQQVEITPARRVAFKGDPSSEAEPAED